TQFRNWRIVHGLVTEVTARWLYMGQGLRRIKPGGARSPGSMRRFSGYCYCCGASLPYQGKQGGQSTPECKGYPLSVTSAASASPFSRSFPQGLAAGPGMVTSRVRSFLFFLSFLFVLFEH